MSGTTAQQDAYRRFLRGPVWADLRARRIALDSHRCADCGHDGSEFRLEVHHLTYERAGGAERLQDLQTLCDPCHSLVHGTSADALPIAGPSKEQLSADGRHRDELRQRLRLAQRTAVERIRDLETRAANGEQVAQRALFVINQRLDAWDRHLAARQ